MPFYRGEYLSYEEYGRIKEQEHEEYQRRVAEMTPTWIAEGAELRSKRERLKVSRTELRPLVGASEKTIARLEKGFPVQRRSMLKAGYNTALKYIHLCRNCKLTDNRIEHRVSVLEKRIIQLEKRTDS